VSFSIAGPVSHLVAQDAKDPKSGEKPATKPAAAETPPARPVLRIETISAAIEVPLDDLRLTLARSSDGGVPRLRAAESEFALDEVLFLRFPLRRQVPPALEFVFLSGESLAGRVGGSSGETLVVENAALAAGKVNVELTGLRAVLSRSGFESASDWGAFKARHLAVQPPSDEVHAGSGGRFTGIVDAVDAAGVRFSSDSLGKVSFPFDKIRAVVFAALDAVKSPAGPAARPETGIRAVVDLSDGSRLHGDLAGIDGSALKLRHGAFGELDVKTDAVSQVSFRGGRCQFLSDLDPESAQEHLGANLTEKVARFYTFKRDANVLGGPIRLAGRTFSKGLGVHAYSRLEYRLEAKFQRFQATIGLDDTARPPPNSSGAVNAVGHVVFRVHLDAKKLAEVPMSYRDRPQPLDLDVRGGSKLVLEVDFGQGDSFFARDRADWAEARVLR
jgi:hypothetical protein